MVCVSIHLVTYNNQATLAWCLDSLMPCLNSDVRVLAIDNGSIDGTDGILKTYGIPIIRNERNRGYAAGHNQALRATQSEYVLTLNPDVHLQPLFIERLVQVLESKSDCGSASGCLLRVEHPGDTPKSIDSAGLYMRPNRRQGLRYEGMPIDYQSRMPLTEIFGPDGAAAFYRRKMLEDISIDGEAFDEDFMLHKEDIDVCWRARLQGWSSIVVPEATAEHIRTFRPGKRQRVSAQLRQWAIRNRYLLMMKNEVAAHFLRNLPQIAIYDAGILAYGLLREPQMFAALRSAWSLRARMRAKRATIQARRVVRWQEMAVWFSGKYL
jgi:GT2 family glycosyltransferase